MRRLIILALIGLAAQLVDGSLGMAYGVTSSSLLLLFGIAPAVASASVHMAEVVTTAASGVSHLRFGNVDKQVVKKLILPGSIGAFTGAVFLGSIPGNLIKPYVSFFLLCLGFYVIYRFLFFRSIHSSGEKPAALTSKFFIPLGFIAGFFDSTGGGGWGPIATPVLLSKKMEARKVIGTVDTSEFAIALSATLGFILTLGWTQFNWQWVIALMVGGLVAAPIAAWLVRIIPSHLLGVLVGGMIIMTNTRTLMDTASIPHAGSTVIYAVLMVLWLIGILYVWRKAAQSKRESTFN
ncbi:sulfite exporter TauE/SafE family protein [Mesobacillus zeae]|uniref:Probable membrane transporter protein n=1 Tax=Mesobacillus zeae TaxID=1917180 RepID=A0A398BJZ9_9BACI|nr:sulfite exporter TauE/SafE family protein [Mesobacillus zeae]RID88808.1 sulfite exporter TauE/SafE family protein [Mesobacillus zeae]